MKLKKKDSNINREDLQISPGIAEFHEVIDLHIKFLSNYKVQVDDLVFVVYLKICVQPILHVKCKYCHKINSFCMRLYELFCKHLKNEYRTLCVTIFLFHNQVDKCQSILDTFIELATLYVCCVSECEREREREGFGMTI